MKALLLAAVMLAATAQMVAMPLANKVFNKPVPTLPEEFTAHLHEVADPSGELVVHMVMAHDLTNNRGRSDFLDGPSFPFPVTQIIRWDIDEFFVVFNNTKCQETKQTGKMNVFFDFPDNVTYIGEQTILGRACDCWSYTDLGDEYHFCGANATHGFEPVRVAAITGAHLWHTDYSNFTPGVPPLSTYDTPAGVKCEPGESAIPLYNTLHTMWSNIVG
eukprot:CAMPEP_0114555066 /NCGR_PEP_ID=MMETSP0114-20121206/8549_1 /TAXON_ID=31324 /ORGANISM="Goniomonas sp, Strain m" /LENGTH=217 /DNA_ID=CAMNT_0001740163 /DNA_START=13 /DNA_END=666 /DNA_ORIENTATION=-